MSVGLFGLILFVVMMVVYLQKAMSYLHYRKDEFRPVVIACVSGNIAVLVLSFMNEGFFDARVFFAFISVMAIAVSSMRVGDEQFERDSTNSYLSGNSADVVLTTSL